MALRGSGSNALDSRLHGPGLSQGWPALGCVFGSFLSQCLTSPRR